MRILHRSDAVNALVWALMMLLTLVFVLVPFIPGIRSIPRWIPVHRLIWRNWNQETTQPTAHPDPETAGQK